MIATMDVAMHTCEQYRDHDGFCTRNCACSGMSFGGTLAQHNSARAEAEAAGIKRYDLVSGKCGDWCVIPLDSEGRYL